jgi:hypothetical protein
MNGMIAKLLEYFQKQGVQISYLEESHLTTREIYTSMACKRAEL